MFLSMYLHAYIVGGSVSNKRKTYLVNPYADLRSPEIRHSKYISNAKEIKLLLLSGVCGNFLC